MYCVPWGSLVLCHARERTRRHAFGGGSILFFLMALVAGLSLFTGAASAQTRAAALATVLTYSLHDPVSEREVARGMLKMTEPLKVKYRGGFSLLDMKHFAELRGYQGEGYRDLTLDDLLQLKDPIVPVVQHGYPHFVVVRGLDRRGRIKLADPGFGNRTMSVRTFTGAWQGGIGFVVVP